MTANATQGALFTHRNHYLFADYYLDRRARERQESDVIHDLLAGLVEQMIAMNKQKGDEMRGFLAWLERETGHGGAGMGELPSTSWRSCAERWPSIPVAASSRNRFRRSTKPASRCCCRSKRGWPRPTG